MHQVGDQRGQPVVVAEPDLVGGDRVVLVDDRDDAERRAAGQGALGVAVVRAADDVVGGEQHLADGEAVPGERRRCSGATSSPWPTLAAACWVARSRGRRRSPSGASPAAIAPGGDQHDLAPLGAAGAGEGVDEARRRDAPSSPPPGVVSDDEPTLTTTRRGGARRSPSLASVTAVLSCVIAPSASSRGMSRAAGAAQQLGAGSTACGSQSKTTAVVLARR